MAEQHDPEDTSALDKLVEITEQMVRLKEYCDKAEALKDAVDPGVFERVTADYAQRRATFEQEATARKSEARAAHRHITARRETLQRSFDEARFHKEELELRGKVGEIDEQELTPRLAEAQTAVTHCQAELRVVNALHDRFLEALGPPVEPDEGTAVELEATKLVASVATTKQEPVVQAQSSTRLVAAGWGDAKTVVLPKALLMSETGGTQRKEFCLGAVNYVGSDGANQVAISGQGVSRRHAVITAGQEGFAIKDLKSRNGTFVNGERVVEHTLADGDRIDLGESSLVFRLG